MACPICNGPEGSAISDGIRAGAMVMIAVAGFVIAAIVRFGVKLWLAERGASIFAKAAVDK